MKIIMLGHSNVGKTTYMATMYGMLQSPIKGFSLLTTNRSHHQELQELHQNIRNGRYPLPNERRQTYQFSLLHQKQAFFPFEWIDYRGGALLERSSSEQATQLINDLRGADGILIFCDSDPKEEMNVIRQVNRMMQFVGQSLQDRYKPATIVVVFTKCDLTNKPDYELFAPTRNLVETISRSETVIGTLISVSCGRKSINIDIPVLFALGLGVLIERRLFAKEVDYYRRLEKEYNDTGIITNLGQWWRGERTSWSKATDAAKSAQANLDKIEELVKPSEELAKYLGGSWLNNSWRRKAKTSDMSTQVRWEKVENLIQPGDQLTKYLKRIPMF